MNPAVFVREWLDKLAPRERVLVLAAAIFACCALVYALGLQPLYAARGRAAAQVEERRSLLSDIEQVARRFGPQAAAAGPVAATGESLVVVIDRSTRERGLGAYLKRNQPEGAGGVRLRLENAPFDELTAWLADVQARHGLSAVSASFDPSGEPGRVNSNLVLERIGR
ncbi:MAG: type II secretion system protein M [Chromatiales bacterium]|nr:type II secretion system protein M [Chromatiales bacterium]